MSREKPRYRFVGREAGRGFTDDLIWQNVDNPRDEIMASEWWFWRLWRYYPMNAAHPRPYVTRRQICDTLCDTAINVTAMEIEARDSDTGVSLLLTPTGTTVPSVSLLSWPEANDLHAQLGKLLTEAGITMRSPL